MRNASVVDTVVVSNETNLNGLNFVPHHQGSDRCVVDFRFSIFFIPESKEVTVGTQFHIRLQQFS
jgi:hypothetical protein